MLPTPYHAYCTARQLEQQSETFTSVFASSNIKIYPFQIAAAHFAIRSPYQRGVVLCDESGMGKSHEAMLVIAQRWYVGKTRTLIVIPNSDLLDQWVALIEDHYTIPYVIVGANTDGNNPFQQDGIILATYDFVAEHELLAGEVSWDLTVFEEATVLSSVYKEDNKQAKALKRVSANSFSLLLTGTPIEKNIMDLYGLMYFIDECILPSEQEFLKRYLRRPENYPELSQQVSQYCFRTLRTQAKQYAKLPDRIPLTYEYTPSQSEQLLYQKLFAYCNQERKQAFPEMNAYDLSLRLLGLLSSSTAAIIATLRGIINRLQDKPQSQGEITQLQEMVSIAQNIARDAKTDALLNALPQIFKGLKRAGGAQKALVFTESVVTQRYLQDILSPLYSTVIYNGSSDYNAIQDFKKSAQILISTDHGARGFNLEECCFVVQYDLLYNTLKMEQRIDRAHRLGQQNDVLVLSFINKQNFADVRKLELVNKRMLVADGVFGLSDEVVGGFTDQLDQAINGLCFRTQSEIEHSYHQTLASNESANRKLVSVAEDILFTTFTPKLAGKLTISPNYISRQVEQMNHQLWDVVKWYFTQYNRTHSDCKYVIDDSQRTITATEYEALPVLFYYWSCGQNRKYRSQKIYGMGADFKPKAGRITFTSVIGRGILHETTCADSGKIQVEAPWEPCTVALYSVIIQANKRIVANYPVLVGRRNGGEMLTEDECQSMWRLPVIAHAQEGREKPAWLRTSSYPPSPLDTLVPTETLLERQRATLTEPQQEEVERMKLASATDKSALQHGIEDMQLNLTKLERELEEHSSDRMKTIVLQRQVNQMKKSLLQKQDGQFFQQMELDVTLDKQIDEFLGREILTTKMVRQFVVEVE